MRTGASSLGYLMWWLYSVALLVRVVAVSVTGHWLTPETFEYDVMATNLLAGRGLVYQSLGIPYASFTGPVYPALCAAVYALTGSSRAAMIIVQALLSSMLPVVIAAIGRALFDHRSGICAGLLVALHPGLVLYATKLHPLIIEALLFGLIGLGVLRLRQRPSWFHRGWVGAALGLMILSRPTALVLIPLVAGWLVWCWPGDRREALRIVMVTLAIALGVVLPWTARNALIHHRFLLVQSTSGQSFWKGNNPQTVSGNLDAQGRDLFSIMPRELRDRLKGATNELQQQHMFWEEAHRYVVQHPWAFVELLGKKLMAFWWFSPTTGWSYPRWYLMGYQWWYVWSLGLMVLGAWRGLGHAPGERRHEAWLLVLACVTISVGQSLFYVEGRHRWAVEPLLLVFAGKGLAELWHRVAPLRMAESC